MIEAADTWQVGDVRVTRVVDTENDGYSRQRLFPTVSREQIMDTDWLHPHYANADGDLKISTHAFVLESQGSRIVVDTCIGNDKPRSSPSFNQLATPFLQRLSAAGHAPEEVDYVLCTHLHVDHVGWNTRWNGGSWIPTFPNARYLFGRIEWDHWQEVMPVATDPHDVERSVYFADSLQPILDAGLADFVEVDHRITDEVRLFHSPGHTPGHVCVQIKSRGCEAMITGDFMHHPVQIADTGICSSFDSDRAQGVTTRTALIERAADKGILLLGSHFARPSGGWVVKDDNGRRLGQTREQAAPSA